MSTPLHIQLAAFDNMQHVMLAMVFDHITKNEFAKLPLKFNDELTEEEDMRDNQRSKVYKAENVVFSSGEKMTLKECEKYVAKVWKKREFLNSMGFKLEDGPYFDTRTPQVLDGRGRRSGVSYGGAIALPKFARNEWYILHELAHEITTNRVASHGPEFCRNYLILVETFLGFEARECLGASFRKHKVKIKR